MGMRAAVAMSGGVDSSAAALLLARAGWELLGLTMVLLTGDTPGCAPECALRARQDVRDAARTARALGFPHRVLDLSGPFREKVMAPFAAAYEGGTTPNPCVACNRAIKFGALLDEALALGCGQLATGHYARVEYHTPSGRWLLKQAVHREKDQSYVLALLTQGQLSRTRLPWGG